MLRRSRALLLLIALGTSPLLLSAPALQEEEEVIEIIEGKDDTVYEYRQNGVLVMIKVVPDAPLAKPYYMVPADGSPHYDSLEFKKKLYPKWVIVEW